MASDFFDDSLGGLLSSGQDDEEFDPGDLIPKCLDRRGRDLLALGAALNAHNGESGHVHHGENGLLTEIGHFRQADADSAGDERTFPGDILQLDHILNMDED